MDKRSDSYVTMGLGGAHVATTNQKQLMLQLGSTKHLEGAPFMEGMPILSPVKWISPLLVELC